MLNKYLEMTCCTKHPQLVHRARLWSRNSVGKGEERQMKRVFFLVLMMKWLFFWKETSDEWGGRNERETGLRNTSRPLALMLPFLASRLGVLGRLLLESGSHLHTCLLSPFPFSFLSPPCSLFPTLEKTRQSLLGGRGRGEWSRGLHSGVQGQGYCLEHGAAVTYKLEWVVSISSPGNQHDVHNFHHIVLVLQKIEAGDSGSSY